MKAVLVSPNGVPELREAPDPHAGPGELLIRIRVAAVNPVDGFTAEDGPREQGWAAADAVLALGWDFVGDVVESPAGDGFPNGATVAGIVPEHTSGTFAQYVAVPRENVALVPANLDPDTAVTVPLAGLTAGQALAVAGEPRGELLVTGAAGAVGGFAVALASAAGWRVAGMAREADRAAVARTGATAITALPNVPRYAAAIDAAVLGAPVADSILDGGVYVGLIPGSEPGTTRLESTSFMVHPDAERLAQLLTAVLHGDVTTHVRARYPLDRFAQALADAATPGARGKVLVTI